MAIVLKKQHQNEPNQEQIISFVFPHFPHSRRQREGENLLTLHAGDEAEISKVSSKSREILEEKIFDFLSQEEAQIASLKSLSLETLKPQPVDPLVSKLPEKEIEETRMNYLKTRDMLKKSETDVQRMLQEAYGEKERIIREALKEKERILFGAEEEANKKIGESSLNLKKIEKKAQEKAYQETYENGKKEIDFLVKKLNSIADEIWKNKEKILSNLEDGLMNIILSMTRKVIKVSIQEQPQEILRANLRSALGKLGKKGNIVVRLNSEDFQGSSTTLVRFLEVFEGVESVKILEDPNVDPAGFLIETDYGDIDARISVQMAELEKRIQSVSLLHKKTLD